ncbi:MAG: 4-(cytidine 5'-diphospho)-2-C-methyl-D-erythritol kinase [Gemmatimonadaceae bacterium]|nr:4-(cytidine 5'-diphospho)-2-C-methyl-D-erythritol kinase [Gemmatimonadaceae bacterium]
MSAPRAECVELRAQAKVNLRLEVLARETSGFHQLETLFLRLELADRVRVRRTSSSRSLDVSGVDRAGTGPVERNLAWRAATLYADEVGLTGGFSIELEKRIPTGGGLGGGSADAGAVLRALDALSARPLGTMQLTSLAISLGADVPFLTSEHACALAWGRGERMLVLRAPEARDVLLLVPSFAIGTADAYEWLAGAVEDDDHRRVRSALFDAERDLDWPRIAARATNAFEPVVRARHPEIGELVEALGALGCGPAMMSGSGSVVFGVLPADGDRAALSPDELAGLPARVIRTRTAARVEPVSPIE